jgi:hypothetical protein
MSRRLERRSIVSPSRCLLRPLALAIARPSSYRNQLLPSSGIIRIGTVKLSAVGLGEAGVVGYLARMTTHRDPLFAGYRYPAELISYAVWLYFRFPLSLRMVEEMLAARGVSVTYG